jgi:hypothetical protein
VIVTSCFRRGQNSVQNTATKTDSMHQCSILHKQTDMMEKKNEAGRTKVKLRVRPA